MWRENLYRPAEVLVREHDVFPIGEHRHAFFELTWIRFGTGTFGMTGETPGTWRGTLAYGPGTLLLVPPEALHRFTVGTRTGFVFIRFTGSYIAESLGTFVEQALLASATPCITPEGGNAAAVQALVGMLTAEPEAADGFSSTLRQQLVGSIVTLAARSVLHRSATPLPAPPEGDKDARLVAYIQRNIHRPERLKTEALCDIFHISPGYMGRYFKRRFHESLREYIAGSRIRAVERMLCDSRMSIKEIAYKMGYTDSSHLIRAFRAHYGMSPTRYRAARTGDSY